MLSLQPPIELKMLGHVVIPFCLILHCVGAVDQHENCEFWAVNGECDANPNYMLNSCSEACAKVTAQAATTIPESFYSIVESDINGNPVVFEKFRGKVVYIVNVASQCGYTKENYDTLQRLSQMRSDSFEILIFPCNQFGQQEPGGPDEVAEFARSHGYGGIIMSKGSVNGANTRPTFQFLKDQTSKKTINWNFDGKFVIDASGNARFLSGEVVEIIADMLSQREL